MTVDKMLKMMFLLGSNMEMSFSGGDKHLEGEYTTEGFFSGSRRENEQIFG